MPAKTGLSLLALLALASAGCTMCASPYDDCSPVVYSHATVSDAVYSGGSRGAVTTDCPNCQAPPNTSYRGAPQRMSWKERFGLEELRIPFLGSRKQAGEPSYRTLR